MMTWNYRILYHAEAIPEPYYALHEVYYDDAGNPGSWTTEPIDFVAGEDEGAKGIIDSLGRALVDASMRPVLAVHGEKLEPMA